ncbi:hypothetical protein SAMD00079811_32910 [Scytonema sp. HK-05]|nr:hypothetical protein SAMD00079811_32910 [Scytonema sp. HK-05]
MKASLHKKHHLPLTNNYYQLSRSVQIKLTSFGSQQSLVIKSQYLMKVSPGRYLAFIGKGLRGFYLF